MTNRATATLVALFLAALTLRPQIVGVGPLIPSIQDAFGTSHAVVGLLGTIPVLCMGLFAPGRRVPRGEDRDAPRDDDRRSP